MGYDRQQKSLAGHENYTSESHQKSEEKAFDEEEKIDFFPPILPLCLPWVPTHFQLV